MTGRQHDWHRPNFFSRDACRACLALRHSPQALAACPGAVVRSELAASIFGTIERKLVDYFDVAVPDATTLQEAGEWYAEVDGRRISLSAMALTVAEELGIADARS